MNCVCEVVFVSVANLLKVLTVIIRNIVVKYDVMFLIAKTEKQMLDELSTKLPLWPWTYAAAFKEKPPK